MRHLHFVQSLDPLRGGGLGRAALELHLAFREAGVASRLISTKAAGFAESWDDTTQYVRSWPEKAFYAPALQGQVRELVQASDIVHGHGFYVATNWLVGRETRRQGKLLVYHAHGFFEPWILRRSRWRKQVAHWLFENANFRSAGLWRALTPKEAAQIRAQRIQAPCIVVPNGIDPSPFDRPLPTALHEGRRCLLYLGRLHPKKGLDLLVTAWSQLSQVHRDWTLRITGPDEDGYLRELQSLADRLDGRKTIQFADAVAGHEKVELLRSADLFVLPSYSEGFSVAILEAMAARVPVVATEACNFPGLFAAGGGWECAATRESLETALHTALEASDQERRERGRKGRRLMEAQYRWPVIARTLLEACEEQYHHGKSAQRSV